MSRMTYDDALDYLYSYVDYSLQRTYRYSPQTFDLNRMRVLLDLLGNPQEAYPVIHVAGTKGKGSVSALTASALRAAGYQTGFYTSPHLVDFSERIQFNGHAIPHERLSELTEQIRPGVAKVPGLTTFEITTALAFMFFASEKAEVAVIEVGLGGRLDATNVVQPLVSVITSLSYDHTHLLGHTLAEIAREKAGIVKPGVPLVSAPQESEALRVLKSIAEERQSPLVLVGRDWLFAPLRHSLDGQSLTIWSAASQERVNEYLERSQPQQWEWVPPRFDIPLLGYHQVINATVAYAALQVANGRGLHVSEEAIREGFQTVEWPARFQILHRAPFVVADSAHNRDSARRLRTALDDYFPARRVILIFGASADKDINGILDELVPRVSLVFVTHAEHPRASETDDLVERIRARGCPAEAVVPVGEALARALENASDEDVVLSAGSMFVSADVLRDWPQVWEREAQRRAARREERRVPLTSSDDDWA
ncbi:MAG TPA: folylpolyglutamate synthase/dihydrofolate synthase family protein [Anaerolineales bacterium]|nr:folylpolyglutamate synthase/dihydrofolate synthase family protein [Anaerolineales bacterium]